MDTSPIIPFRDILEQLVLKHEARLTAQGIRVEDDLPPDQQIFCEESDALMDESDRAILTGDYDTAIEKLREMRASNELNHLSQKLYQEADGEGSEREMDDSSLFSSGREASAS